MTCAITFVRGHNGVLRTPATCLPCAPRARSNHKGVLGTVVSAISTFIALETSTMQERGRVVQKSFTSVYEEASTRSCGSSPSSSQSSPSWQTASQPCRSAKTSLCRQLPPHGPHRDRPGRRRPGVVTVVVGSLPSLGLIVLDLVCMTLGDNLPWVCLAGIALATVTDLLARASSPQPDARLPSSWASSGPSSSSRSCARPRRATL